MADLILIIHFCFIIFVIFGGILTYRVPRLAWIHIPMVLWAFLVNIMEWICPLTPLENLYRRAIGQADYESGFIEHYLMPLIYPETMSYELGVFLGIAVFGWNVLIYAFIRYLKSK